MGWWVASGVYGWGVVTVGLMLGSDALDGANEWREVRFGRWFALSLFWPVMPTFWLVVAPVLLVFRR